jgi:hypothetical protein
VNPERILEHQPDIHALVDAMLNFGNRMLVPDQRQQTLVTARVNLHSIKYHSDPFSFAQELVAAFIERPVPERGAQDHPMVRLLEYFLDSGPDRFGLTDHDTAVLQYLIAGAHDRAGALKARRSVGRLEDAKGRGIGTGVVIGPDLLLTCQHVFSKTRVDRALVRFDCTSYAACRDPRSAFELKLDGIVDSGSDRGLDYVLFRVSGRPTRPVQARRTASLNGDDEIRMIHHPDGQPAVVSDVGRVVHVARDYILHGVPTAEGSSGAPIFNRDWELVALHRGDGPRATPDAAEGVPVHAFWEALQAHLPPSESL